MSPSKSKFTSIVRNFFFFLTWDAWTSTLVDPPCRVLPQDRRPWIVELECRRGLVGWVPSSHPCYMLPACLLFFFWGGKKLINERQLFLEVVMSFALDIVEVRLNEGASRGHGWQVSFSARMSHKDTSMACIYTSAHQRFGRKSSKQPVRSTEFQSMHAEILISCKEGICES